MHGELFGCKPGAGERCCPPQTCQVSYSEWWSMNVFSFTVAVATIVIESSNHSASPPSHCKRRGRKGFRRIGR